MRQLRRSARAGRVRAGLTVQVEDGRTFVRCLVTRLETDGVAARRRLITTP